MLDIETILKLLGRWLWLLAVGAIVGIAATYLVLDYLGLVPCYEATVTLTVGIQVEGATLSSEELGMGEILVPSYVVLAERPPVTQAVVDNLHLSMSADDLATWRLEVAQSGQTRVMGIVAKDPNPEMAAAIANEVARQLVESAPLRPYGFVQIVAPAKVPEKPTLEPYLIMAIGAMVGMLLAATVALFIEVKRDRPQTLSWAAARIHVPLLGTFKGNRKAPSLHRQVEGSLAADHKRGQLTPVWWVAMETFGRLLAERGNAVPAGQGCVVVVTSPVLGRGNPIAAVELARAWATTGTRVILVDADTRRPAVHRWFNLPNQKGTTTFLTQAGQTPEQLDSLIASSSVENLAVLTSGPLPAEDSALLLKQPWQRLISLLREKADMVIVNSPSVCSEPEAVILATHADAVLLVIDLGKTPSAAANRAADILLKSGSRVLGAVVNKR